VGGALQQLQAGRVVHRAQGFAERGVDVGTEIRFLVAKYRGLRLRCQRRLY